MLSLKYLSDTYLASEWYQANSIPLRMLLKSLIIRGKWSIYNGSLSIKKNDSCWLISCINSVKSFFPKMSEAKERTHEEVHSHTSEFTPKRTIMVAIDESESSKYTIDLALKTIVGQEDQVVLVNCRPAAFNEFNIELGYPYVIPNGSFN